MNKYSLVGGLLLLLTVFAGGFYIGKGERVVEIREGKTITVTKTRIVTVTKTVLPDGTTTESTTTTEKEREKDETETDTTTTPMLADYSIGAKYWLSRDSLTDPTSISNLEITAGRRLIGDMWLDIGVRADPSIAVGLSLKF